MEERVFVVKQDPPVPTQACVIITHRHYRLKPHSLHTVVWGIRAISSLKFLSLSLFPTLPTTKTTSYYATISNQSKKKGAVAAPDKVGAGKLLPPE